MSKNATRVDTVCLNCEHPNVVERFCPGCGQENVDTHQSFHHLVFHIVEDLTHYDGNVWRTIKNLLFHPARLTKVYLAGKRKKFVPPVKLYIFISFLTFFLIALLPDLSGSDYDGPALRRKVAESDVVANAKAPAVLNSANYATVKEFDSIQGALPADKKLGFINSYMSRRVIASLERNTDREIYNKMDGLIFQNMPKAIFLFLPIFGFLLWVFHGKKRWFFFDHAIFTLHYFAFILLWLTITVTLLQRVYFLLPETAEYIMTDITSFVTVGWIIIYFYIGHKRMYHESGLISFLKTTALVVVNFFLLLILQLLLLWYSFISI
ncbi:MAG TPA: DUF3667 domain-containing protein [Flavobacterium sp.]|jgi:hypothetical protein